jgi:hypothetical protein
VLDVTEPASAYRALLRDTTGPDAGAPRRVVVQVHTDPMTGDDPDDGGLLVEYEVTDLKPFLSADPDIETYDPDQSDAERVLKDHGWRMINRSWHPAIGYARDAWQAYVRPDNWRTVVKAAGLARTAAQEALDRAEVSWRLAIRRAQIAYEEKRSYTGATEIGGVATPDGISRQRVHQIRHGAR